MWKRLRGGELGPGRAAASVGVGLFVGCLPVYGLHLPLCLGVCVPLRLDGVVAYVAANISNPLVAPFLLTLEVETGALLLTGRPAPFDVARARAVGISGFAAHAVLGSLVVGTLLALLGAVVAWALAARGGRAAEPEVAKAVDRTLARYRDESRSDRGWVRGKLRSDPALGVLAGLGPLGHVIDLGCGRGQLSLALLEMGRARSLVGCDWDARKIDVATRAAARVAAGDAAPLARFESAELASVDVPSADSVLLIDVLHYLPEPEQEALLDRAVNALEPGGRLVVREIDRDAGLPAQIGMLAERFGVRIGANRGRAHAFRDAAGLALGLERRGLSCTTLPSAGWLPNVVMVGERRAVPADRVPGHARIRDGR